MTTPPSSLPPANWYPDPQTPGQLRYWDGQRWTQHVHPAQQPAQGVGGAGAVQPQAGPGVFLPSGRPGSAVQAGQAAGPAQGSFTPTQGAGPAQGSFTPTQGAGPAQGGFAPAQGGFTPVQGAGPAQGGFTPVQGGFAPTQGAGPAQGGFVPVQGGFVPVQGGFTPTQGAGPAQGGFAPVQGGFAPDQAGAAAAGPATGAQPLAQVIPTAAGPGTGSLSTFQPGAVGGPAPLQAAVPRGVGFDVDDIPRGQGRSGSYNSPSSSGTSRQSQLALLVGLLALLTTGISIYGLGTDFDAYVTYAAGGIGFMSVFFGFAGIGKALQGGGGRGRSILAVALGFLAIGLNTYEYLNRDELHDIIAGLF